MKLLIRRLQTTILLAAMLLSAVSCGAQGDAENRSGVGTTTAAEETTASDEPVLPEKDFGGDEFKLLIRKAATYTCDDICVDTLNGEIVNDTVFNRNIEVERKFNLRLSPNYSDDPSGTAQKSILAGENIADILFDRMDVLFEKSADRQYIDLKTLDYIDFDAAWWDSNSAKELAVCDKLYMAVSDISMNASSRARFLYFNKKLLEDYSLQSPYEYVYNDQWTLDTFGSMVRSVSEDLNGDGTMDGNDRFGILQEGPTYFISGAGVLLTENDSDGIPRIAFVNDRTVTAMEKIKSIISDKSCAISYENASKGMDTTGFAHIYNYGRSLFAHDHFLFVQNGANVAYQFADMESEFGIVPNPKLDETQTEYHHLMDPMACAMSVPITNSDTDRTAVVLEYMSWLSSKTLVPAYYETTIKIKRFNDDNAPEMLDIVRSSILYELFVISDIGLKNIISSGYEKGSIASVYAKSEKAIASKIDKLIEKFTSDE